MRWLTRLFRRPRPHITAVGPSIRMDWLTGEGTRTDHTTGETERFSAGRNALGMPDWVVDAVEGDKGDTGKR